ncbi:MAG: tetratricopeptide repeat protein [Myxococcales bacterium]|nr:tetratricopeptide repeat protein [Myxococcales bacterium]
MRRWLCAALLTAPWAAWAQDAGPPAADGGEPDPARVAQLVAMADDAITGLARERNLAGLKAFRAKDFPAALQLFREAHDLAPGDPEITNNLGFLYQALGNRAEAERWYRETLDRAPQRGVAWLNLADLLAEGGQPEALAQAAEALVRARQIRGNAWKIIRRQARVATARGLLADAERFYREAGEAGDEGLALEIGDFFREQGRTDDALGWYRRVQGDGLLAEASQRIRAVQVDLQARRYGWTAPDAEVPAAARARFERATAASKQGQAKVAERLLREALGEAPLFAEAHGALAELLAARGAHDEAERAWLRALVLDGGNAELLAGLGRFLAQRERPGEAAFFLGRAVAQRPDWLALQLDLALAWQAAGELPRALRRVELYLAALPEDAPAEAARALRATLRASLPDAPADPPEQDPTPSALGQALARARGALAAGDPGKAMAALEGLEHTPAVLNLRGRILLATGRLAEAEAAFAESLAAAPKQAAIWEQRALVARGRDRTADARGWLERAEVLGSPTAALRLARLDADRGESPWPDWIADLGRWGRLAAARDRLTAYLAAGAPGGEADGARALFAELRRRQRAAWIALGGGALALLGLLGLALRRVWGGAGLEALLARHPDTGPEVQQVLSAIRHEVLKHNTMVLTGLVDAIELGEPFADQAAWCRRSLLGAPGGKGEGSAHARLRGYAARLARLGRARGLRLNLRRNDKALSALLEGFRTLEGAAGLLDRAPRLGPGGQARLLRALRRAARLLNVQGYEGVRALLDQLRVLRVDAALLETLFSRTCNEPAFAEARIAPLAIEADADALPTAVVVPRYAFDDILHNLLRNGIQSSLAHCPAGEPVRIGLGVAVEVDPITGLARVALRILDRSPQRLTPEMLRGRYIEEGLGLTADLVSRHEGTLDVEGAAPPWQKAVVVKLPLHDADEET